MSKQISVTGGNLFKIAVEQYGDAMGWVQIAQANGLTDPYLTGLVTLTIPDYNGNKTGVWNG
jgi:nucleoid-associated protein YgaU